MVFSYFYKYVKMAHWEDLVVSRTPLLYPVGL